MSVSPSAACRAPHVAPASILGRFVRCQSGTTAIEFGMVLGPFLMFAMGVVLIGINFLTTYSLENAVEKAARQIRTGQAQQAEMTASQFKQLVCDKVVEFVDCQNKLQIHVQSWSDFSSVNPTSCLASNGSLTAGNSGSSKIGDATGGASQIVLVTACYEFDLMGKIPLVNLGNMESGARLVQAATVFRTEPYQ